MGPFDLEKLIALLTQNPVATLLGLALMAVLGLFAALLASHRRERETLLKIAPLADKALDLLEHVAPLLEDLLETRAHSRARRRSREPGAAAHAANEPRAEGKPRNPGTPD